ncbi:MAG: helix-turn-helix domain-containing protein [Gammaproteobacteria bacterium]|nr:helix-turn-helix domain-containing protein [Gammaproteobacteria bacterium]MCY4218563.1 helix-turn-helix domain-containing protein [Gammaproteobacteria bacterium]MCY4273833.1 helix-turn-helix domain-containing protein [Gammaproteobacteria bacterium]
MNPEVGQVSVEKFHSIGQTLRNSRESQKLSRTDVANSLKLGQGFIAALENDQYDLLPGHTYIRGYIRSYCALLKLNSDDLLDKLELGPETNIGIASTTNLNVPAQRATSPRRSNRYRWLIWIIFTIIAISLGGLYTTFQFLDQSRISIPNLLESKLIGQEEQTDNGVEPVDEKSDSSQPIRIEGLAIPVE